MLNITDYYFGVDCPSCAGVFYHFAGCPMAEHGTVITREDREKWTKALKQEKAMYDVLVQAQVRGNEI